MNNDVIYVYNMADSLSFFFLFVFTRLPALRACAIFVRPCLFVLSRVGILPNFRSTVWRGVKTDLVF